MDTKRCPYCAEEIKAAAIVCKHCGRDLPPEDPKPEISEEEVKRRRAQAVREKLTKKNSSNLSKYLLLPTSIAPFNEWENWKRYSIGIAFLISLGILFSCCCIFTFSLGSSINVTDESSSQTTVVSESIETVSATDTERPTATSTQTETPTSTPSPTPTNTDLPETATQKSINATQTVEADSSTATAQSANSTATQKAENATETQAAYWAPFTATAEVRNAYATQVASYSKISRQELVNYSDDHAGEMIVVQGRVFNIINREEIQIWLDNSYDPLYIIFLDPISEVYENDWITVYGVVYGEECGTNAFGGTVCSPVLIADFYEKP